MYDSRLRHSLTRSHSSDVEMFSNANHRELSRNTWRIDSRWLLKDMVCRMHVDRYGRFMILSEVPVALIGELLLSERAKLRELLKDIAQRTAL